MAAYPAMPLFTDAYLADTRHLTTEEHGAYLLLLMCAWRSKDCALADDDGALARIAGLSPTKWRRMKPVLARFFDIDEGLWRQAKLTSVYEDVAARVARNRASGAKGGRARARSKAAKPAHPQKPEQAPKQLSKQTGKQTSDKTEVPPKATPQTIPEATPKATPKATLKATKAKAAAKPDTLVLVQAADYRHELAALVGPTVVLDAQTLAHWQEAGVCFDATIKPTIKRLMAREQKRTGSLPKRLAYYREAVLEAHAEAPPLLVPQADKTSFDTGCAEHWRRLLGDAASPFRGDYISQNWFIPTDHPEFAARTLGPNPRFSDAPQIPAIIKAEYGRPWNWLARA